MERLTYRNANGTAYAFTDEYNTSCGRFAERLADYEDTGLSPERCAELAKAEQEGRLVDTQELMGALFKAKFDLTTDSDRDFGMADYKEGYNDCISQIGTLLIMKYGARPLTKAEKALESEGK